MMNFKNVRFKDEEDDILIWESSTVLICDED